MGYAKAGRMTGQSEPHEIWKLLPKKEWKERQEYIARLTSYPEVQYMTDLEQGIRNEDDADVRNAAMEVYNALGIRGYSSLEALLQDHNHEVRLFAVNILCRIADRGTFPLLAEAINDADVNVRVAAAEALGKIKDGRAIALLENAIADEPWVAMAAIDALGQIGGEAALGVLYRCFEMPGMQEYAVATLLQTGKRSVFSVIDAIRSSSDPRRQLFAKAFSMLGEQDILLQFAKDDDPEIRTEVAIALGFVTLPDALKTLKTMLNDPEEEVRMAAKRSLEKMGKEVAP